MAKALSIGVEMVGLEKVERAIEQLQLDLEDLRPAYREVARYAYTFIEGAFQSEGALTDFGAWAPLSRAYARWKARNYPGAPILTRTGALRRSLTAPNAPGSRTIITKESLTIGTSIPYAIYHQSTAPRKKLPRRPPISLTGQQETALIAAINGFLGRRARAAGWVVSDVEGE
jgi:phage gpG-like protein